MRILVIGASGYIGQHLVPLLCQQHYHLCAAARRIEWLQQQNWPDVSYRYLDLHQPDTLQGALQDIDVVYYLAHGMGDSNVFLEREKLAASNLQRELRNSQVREVIFLGALQPQNDTTGQHLQARRQTGEILRASGVPVTEIRASIIIGPGSAAFEVMRDMIYNLPVLTPPRWVRSKTSPIALQNLLYYLTELLHHPASAHRTFDVAGPEYLSYQELFRRFIALSGKRRWMI
ncbi:MAG: NAD(P)H-binding protein, partial [Enterobacteriaceae bacterium]